MRSANRDGAVWGAGKLMAVVRIVVLTLAGLAVVAVFLVVDPLDRLTADEPADATAPRGRAEIAMAELTTTVEADGELLPAWHRPALAAGPGTLTDVVGVGAPVDASTALFELDGHPAVAMIGDVPAWRAMTIDDAGPDVAQLEANLAALGYDPDGAMTVDDVYTGVTADAVERWQTDLGVEATGTVELGTVVFVPGPAEVTSVSAMAGDAVGAGSTATLTVSSVERRVHFTVPAADLDTLTVGAEVSARLPDRTEVTARVDELLPIDGGGRLALASIVEEGAEPVALPAGETVPLTVSWTAVTAAAVTTVPARALTRLDTGAYALEVVEPGGTRFVEVGIGARSGSTVEIITELPAGTEVIAP